MGTATPNSWNAWVQQLWVIGERDGMAHMASAALAGAAHAADAGEATLARRLSAVPLFVNAQDQLAQRAYHTYAADAPSLWPDQPDIVFFTGHVLNATLPFPSQLSTTAIGGSESALLLMATALAQTGLRVAIFAPFAEARRDSNVWCIPIEEFFPYALARGLPVCVVLRFYQPFVNLVPARKRIFWLQDIVAPSYREFYQRIDPHVDEYWVLSDYQQSCYENICGLAAEKFWQTVNVTHPGWYDRVVPWNERRPHTLIYASRPSRGLHVALLTVQQLLPEFPKLELLACAYTGPRGLWEDDELKPLRTLIESLPVRVESFGKIALAEQISHAAAMLYPNTSDLETSCIAAIEAMAAGTPIVTSDRGALPETMVDVGNIVPFTTDPHALAARCAAATRALLTQPTEWQRSHHASRQRYETRYHLATVTRAWMEHVMTLV